MKINILIKLLVFTVILFGCTPKSPDQLKQDDSAPFSFNSDKSYVETYDFILDRMQQCWDPEIKSIHNKGSIEASLSPDNNSGLLTYKWDTTYILNIKVQEIDSKSSQVSVAYYPPWKTYGYVIRRWVDENFLRCDSYGPNSDGKEDSVFNKEYKFVSSLDSLSAFEYLRTYMYECFYSWSYHRFNSIYEKDKNRGTITFLDSVLIPNYYFRFQTTPIDSNSSEVIVTYQSSWEDKAILAKKWLNEDFKECKS